MRTIILCLLQLIAVHVYAQRECGSSLYIAQQRSSASYHSERAIAVEAFIQQNLTVTGASPVTNARTTAVGVIRIPVVVHVVYNHPSQNISDAQVQSQIDALNRDFRRKNADAVNTPAHFQALAADVMIEFELATVDPKGRATSGIVRKQSDVTEWGMDDAIKYSSKGGSSAWDSKSYLNIWVAPLRKVLGYSSEPGGPADKDGIVISTNAFGTIGTAAPFHLGRTAVHEVGHWLGLKHIWGDAFCGDDLVHDTPRQSSYTIGCPTGVKVSCGNDPYGNMYMNYMDFTNDACMNMFTIGQMNRMRSLFNEGGPRYSLTQSKGLTAPWNKEPEVEPIIIPEPVKKGGIFPNPAKDEVMLNLADESWVGQDIQLLNMNGILIKQIRLTSSLQRISLENLPRGIYFIKADNNGNKINHKLVKL